MVLYGLRDSWDQPAAIRGRYKSFTWSPCGQFFSAQTQTSVEVWDALTLEKRSTLQPTNPHTIETRGPYNYLPDVLAYSPGGCSLAGCFGSAIIIWDVQTGGVVKEIEGKAVDCPPQSLVWSSDGTTICTIFPAWGRTWDVVTWEVASGKRAPIGRFRSLATPFLWSNNDSLRVMVMQSENNDSDDSDDSDDNCDIDDNDNDDGCSRATVDILEVWPSFIDHPIESFSIEVNPYNTPLISFSPSTYRISVTADDEDGTLFAFDIRNSKVLFQKEGHISQGHLSPDGSLLAACILGDTSIWKYTSEQGYVLWRKFSFWDNEGRTLWGHQFSPTSSSILISSDRFLEVRHLRDPQTDPPIQSRYSYDRFSTNGAYVVTASHRGPTITITNLRKNLSQSIHVEFDIRDLALTGNVLLAHGVGVVIGWRLTAEGMVDKVPDDRREGDHDGRLWAMVLPRDRHPSFWVSSNIGAIISSRPFICYDRFDMHLNRSGGLWMYYDTETGKEYKPVSVEVPPSSSPSWKPLYSRRSNFGAQSSFSCHDFVHLEDDPPISMPWYAKGWVKYPGGEHRHRFWLPAHWRPGWSEVHWIDDVTTLRLITASGLVIIQF